jgi:hypothetical protein
MPAAQQRNFAFCAAHRVIAAGRAGNAYAHSYTGVSHRTHRIRNGMSLAEQRVPQSKSKGTAMDNKPEGPIKYTVCFAQSGQWDVNEQGFEKPIASFADRKAAVEYANRLAATKTDATVEVS